MGRCCISVFSPKIASNNAIIFQEEELQLDFDNGLVVLNASTDKPTLRNVYNTKDITMIVTKPLLQADENGLYQDGSIAIHHKYLGQLYSWNPKSDYVFLTDGLRLISSTHSSIEIAAYIQEALYPS